MTRNIQVIDFTLGKRDSATSVDTSLPFSKNFGETRTIQQANVVLAAYVNANYLDNFGIRTDVDLLKQNIDSVNETLINLAENITTNNEEISTINGLITTINSTLVTLAENIATNTEDIATLTNGLRDLSEDLTSLETALNSLTSRVTNSEEHITTIETNGVIGTTQYGGTLVNDLNDIIKSGFYTCYTGATGLNAEMLALAVSWHILHQNSNVGTGGAYQRCIAYIAGETVIYERIKIASVWGDFTLKPKRSELTELNNITKFIPTTAGSNGDYKINITNSLITNLFINISFLAPTSQDSNARLSLDNGTTYKNVFMSGKQCLARSLQNKRLTLFYDGTQFNVMNDELVYTTSEVKTGDVGRNGRPIYRKTYTISIGTSVSYSLDIASLAHDSISLDNNYTFFTHSGTAQIPLGHYGGSTDYSRWYINGTNIVFLFGSAYSTLSKELVITVLYTKTAD